MSNASYEVDEDEFSGKSSGKLPLPKEILIEKFKDLETLEIYEGMSVEYKKDIFNKERLIVDLADKLKDNIVRSKIIFAPGIEIENRHFQVGGNQLDIHLSEETTFTNCDVKFYPRSLSTDASVKAIESNLFISSTNNGSIRFGKNFSFYSEDKSHDLNLISKAIAIGDKAIIRSNDFSLSTWYGNGGAATLGAGSKVDTKRFDTKLEFMPEVTASIKFETTTRSPYPIVTTSQEPSVIDKILKFLHLKS